MERTYDIFEKMMDGSMLWRAVVPGREAAMLKLQQMVGQSANEFQLEHLASDTLIATMNPPKSDLPSRSAKERSARKHRVDSVGQFLSGVRL
jgi:hypothetical protein